jgi:hypothetical protein
MKFDTKIAVVLRDDLPVWQQLNMTAFLVSGIASTNEGVTGENYEDATGNIYLPMFVQPVLIFGGSAEQLREIYERVLGQKVKCAIFTEELFSTGHDEANRAAVKAVPCETLKIAGIALRENKKIVAQIVKGLSLHK